MCSVRSYAVMKMIFTWCKTTCWLYLSKDITNGCSFECYFVTCAPCNDAVRSRLTAVFSGNRLTPELPGESPSDDMHTWGGLRQSWNVSEWYHTRVGSQGCCTLCKEFWSFLRCSTEASKSWRIRLSWKCWGWFWSHALSYDERMRLTPDNNMMTFWEYVHSLTIIKRKNVVKTLMCKCNGNLTWCNTIL